MTDPIDPFEVDQKAWVIKNYVKDPVTHEWNPQYLLVDTDGHLQVDILNMNVINSLTADGLVLAGSGNLSKVWMTDAGGVPGWRDIPAGHDPITLDVNADTILSLTGQALGLDTQSPNRVLAGRADAGAAQVPTFRSLVALDIPNLSAIYSVIAHNHAGVYEASGGIATHAALTTGIHGLAITAGQTLTVTTGGTLGSAAYTAATAYEAAGGISTHAALLTGVHGLAITTGKVLTVQDNVTITGALGTGAYATIANYAPLASPTFTGVVKHDNGSAANPSITFTDDADTGFYDDGSNHLYISVAGAAIWMMDSAGGFRSQKSGAYISFSNDAYLYNDITNYAIAVRSGANPSIFRIYHSYTDASNYERFSISTVAGTITLAAETLGTGTDNIDIALTPVGSGNVNITSGALEIAGTQVVGARVIDARIDDAINSGDGTTDGVIDALRDAMIQHGLIAAA